MLVEDRESRAEDGLLGSQLDAHDEDAAKAITCKLWRIELSIATPTTAIERSVLVGDGVDSRETVSAASAATHGLIGLVDPRFARQAVIALGEARTSLDADRVGDQSNTGRNARCPASLPVCTLIVV